MFFFLKISLILLFFLFKISCWMKKLYEISSFNSDICMCLIMTKILYFCSLIIIWNQIFRKSLMTCWLLMFCEKKTDLFFKIAIASLNWSVIYHIKLCISKRKLQMIKFWKFSIIQKKIWVTIHSVLISILNNVFKI